MTRVVLVKGKTKNYIRRILGVPGEAGKAQDLLQTRKQIRKVNNRLKGLGKVRTTNYFPEAGTSLDSKKVPRSSNLYNMFGPYIPDLDPDLPSDQQFANMQDVMFEMIDNANVNARDSSRVDRVYKQLKNKKKILSLKKQRIEKSKYL